MKNVVPKACLVERLMIVHQGLSPNSASGGFDEAASNDELCEQILYYHQFDRMFPSDTRCRYTNDDAIKFAGFCGALYSIQSTIDSQMNADVSPGASATKEVYLSTCTLVFIPLESSETGGILAVAQIPRRPKLEKMDKKKNQSKKNNSLVEDHLTPKEIRYKLEKAHDLFKLTNGGGIHKRLLSKINIEHEGKEDSDTTPAYPGMNKLFEILKNLRKSHMRRNQNPASDVDESLETIQDLEKQLKALTDVLPIDALRLDLRQFYDSFLRHIGESEC
jgi:hypothetical protein